MKKSLLLNKEHIQQKLLELNGQLLKPEYKKNWSESNPTLGYCYILSEVLYHYLPQQVKPYCMSGDFGTHWFVKIDDKIIDFTQDQFDFKVNHQEAVGKGFFKGSIKTKKGFISKRAYELYQHLVA